MHTLISRLATFSIREKISSIAADSPTIRQSATAETTPVARPGSMLQTRVRTRQRKFVGATADTVKKTILSRPHEAPHTHPAHPRWVLRAVVLIFSDSYPGVIPTQGIRKKSTCPSSQCLRIRATGSGRTL